MVSKHDKKEASRKKNPGFADQPSHNQQEKYKFAQNTR